MMQSKKKQSRRKKLLAVLALNVQYVYLKSLYKQFVLSHAGIICTESA